MDANQRESAIALLEEETKIAAKNGKIADVKLKLILEGLDLLSDTPLGDLIN